MENVLVAIVLVAMTLNYVNGNRIAVLEQKLIVMEKSLNRDMIMIRNSIQSISDKLDKALLQQELDKPTSTSDDNVRSGQIHLNTNNIQTEIRRFRRAFTALKNDFKSSVEFEKNKLTNSVTYTRDVINQTLNEVTDKVLAMTTDIHFNVLTFINETNNRTKSLVETATNERRELSDEIKNEIISFKINQGLEQNKTLQEFTDNVRTMTTDISFNISTFINETNNRTKSLVETATNERRELSDEIKNEIISFKINQGLEQNKTLQEFTDNVRTMTTDISFNISTFINETNNRTFSLVETATNERRELSDEIKNEIISFKTNQELNQNKTLQEFTDSVRTMTTDISFNISAFINEANNMTLTLVETATNERQALVEDIKTITKKFDATEYNTARNNELNKDILSSVQYLITRLDNIRLGDYTIDKSSNTVKGRVEVYYSHTWGTVCDDGFSNTGAEVVCRQLGLTGGTQIQEFGSGVGQIWLDDVKCSGSEFNIFQCPRDGNLPIGKHNCGHHEDVGVVCTIPDDLKSLYHN